MMTNDRRSIVLLLFFVTALLVTNPAAAVPIKNPENCQGPVTIGVATCPDKPGHWVECNSHGDYMCCVKNDQGGKDCEQIEAKTFNPKTGVGRLPGGVLQNAPMTVQPGAPRVPRAGMNAPIMRRGVEGETETTAPAPPDDPGK
ncbi:MAG TPA: hypothetical protein VFQ34_03190 [Nitrospiraceae bacterium]|jgi:hypothetical protein|nr:hypothetical protein [Nitrospiraceae bacterium]